MIAGRQPVRLGAISFINTLPIYLDFNRSEKPSEEIDLVYASPARLNGMMDRGELDVSPVSSAFYLQHQERFMLLEDLTVSSPGAVESVLLLSHKPLGPELLDQAVIAVPDASETSVNLLAWLLQDATGQDLRPWFQVYPAADYREILDRTGCALIIGDEALLATTEGTPEGYYCYDLASLWAEKTGLPFVFAVWVAQRDWAMCHAESFYRLNRQLRESRDRFFADPALLAEGVRMAGERCRISPERIRSYYTRSLTYGLSRRHEQALDRFDNILKQLDMTARESPEPRTDTERTRS